MQDKGGSGSSDTPPASGGAGRRWACRWHTLAVLLMAVLLVTSVLATTATVAGAQTATSAVAVGADTGPGSLIGPQLGLQALVNAQSSAARTFDKQPGNADRRSTTTGESGVHDKAKNDNGKDNSDERGPPDHAQDERRNDGDDQSDDNRGPPSHANNSSAVGDDRPAHPPGQDRSAEAHSDNGVTEGQGVPERPPYERVLTVRVSAKRPAAAGSARSGDDTDQDEPDDHSTVQVNVSGAEAGEQVRLDVSTPETDNDEVAFDRIAMTVRHGGTFTLQITSSRRELPGSPAFDAEDGSEALGRIRLDHSITNEEVEDVAFTFRVSKRRLVATATEVEHVALYRHTDAGWTVLPTDVVGETSTHYVLRAESPGMSEFAVGALRPSFELWDASVRTTTVTPDQPAEIYGRVSNVGGADGVYTAALKHDGEAIVTRRLTIAAGGTRQVTFERPIRQPGSYVLYVNDVRAGTVTVERPQAPHQTNRRFPFDWLSDLNLALGLGA